MTADTTPAFRLAAQEYDPAIPVATITEHPDNPNEGNTGVLDESLAEHGFYGAIIVQRSTCYILAGNHRHREAVAAGATTLPGFWLDVDDEQAAKIMVVDNESTRLGRTNAARLVALLKPLTDLRGTGYTEAQLAALLRGQGEGGADKRPPNLADRFLIPPFDVLDARIGWWRDRKRAWLALGITSEVGREGLLAVTNVAAHDPTYYDQKDATEHRLGHELTRAEFEARHYTPAQWGGINAGGTSIFDPVLCELAYRWWCPPGGHVIDPFAGGSVRGLMAAMLGRAYTGCDLSQAQVTANEAAAADFAARGLLGAQAAPAWVAGDAVQWAPGLPPGSADMVFTCPPYFDLETYSDDPADLSTMTDAEFATAMHRVLAGCAQALRPDRFAVVVTGDARNGRGVLRDMRGLVIQAAAAAGLTLASAAVYWPPLGAIRINAGRTFAATRTLSRTHQDLLVFVKGSRAATAAACGHVDVTVPDELAEQLADTTPGEGQDDVAVQVQA